MKYRKEILLLVSGMILGVICLEAFCSILNDVNSDKELEKRIHYNETLVDYFLNEFPKRENKFENALSAVLYRKTESHLSFNKQRILEVFGKPDDDVKLNETESCLKYFYTKEGASDWIVFVYFKNNEIDKMSFGNTKWGSRP